MHASLFLSFLFAVTVVKTELPSYIHVCGKKNPKLDKCIMNSIDTLRDKLRTGIPELDVPIAEPLIIPALKLVDLPTVQADAANLKLYGLLNYTVKSLNVDFDAQRITLNLDYDQLFVDAVYDITGKLLVQIKDKGPIRLDVLGVGVDVALLYKLVQRKGTSYLYFSSMTTKISIKDFKAIFMSKNDGNDTLVTAINAALVSSSKEILETTTPHIEEVISKFVLDVANKIAKHFSFDELFPDRE